MRTEKNVVERYRIELICNEQSKVYLGKTEVVLSIEERICGAKKTKGAEKWWGRGQRNRRESPSLVHRNTLSKSPVYPYRLNGARRFLLT